MPRLIALAIALFTATVAFAETPSTHYGARPFYLVDQMQDGALKDALRACQNQTPKKSAFSIGHRGAPLQFPEHSVEGNKAAARMGAGILECDVTFTKDHALVCRHSQNDLHQTTDILGTRVADQCTQGFTPAENGRSATAECRTTDVTLAQFRQLNAKMDGANRTATNVAGYMAGTASWRTDLYSRGTLMTHSESIALFKSLGSQFMPELKAPVVDMPFNGFTQRDYAQKLIDEYKAAGVPASHVWPQSFDLDDVLYWIAEEPEFGKQAVYLMDEYRMPGYSPMDPATWPHSMAALKEMGVNYIAPPLWMLLTLQDGRIVPSELAVQAKAAGVEMITWTVERSGPLTKGGGWYYQSVAEAIDGDGMVYPVIDVLARDVGVTGLFSDWPATVTYYANCMGL